MDVASMELSADILLGILNGTASNSAYIELAEETSLLGWIIDETISTLHPVLDLEY